MEINNVIALIVLVLAVAGSLFSVYCVLSAKIDRVYERIDEDRQQYHKRFVSQEVYAQGLDHTKEMCQQKQEHFSLLITQQLEGMTKELNRLTSQVEKLLATKGE